MLGLARYLLCSRHCSKHFTYFTLCNLHNNPMKQINDYYFHVIDKETEMQEVKYLAQDHAASRRQHVAVCHMLPTTWSWTSNLPNDPAR